MSAIPLSFVSYGERNMIKFCLAATAAFGVMSGVCFAQTSTTTSTQSTTSTPAPVSGGTFDSSTQRTVDSNGVVIDKSRTLTTGTTITPSGDLGTTRRTTETTTVR
jgi:hypothetical protein